MSLRRFLDCAYAMLVEEYQRIGSDLLTAIEKVNESIGLTVETTATAPVERVPTARDNERALAELGKMMGSL